MNILMSLWHEIKTLAEAALPVLVKVALVYLAIRFALVVANLIVQLAKASSPPKPPQPIPETMEAEVLGEVPPEEASAEESPALPESTSNS
jgi:hypothetical protein